VKFRGLSLDFDGQCADSVRCHRRNRAVDELMSAEAGGEISSRKLNQTRSQDRRRQRSAIQRMAGSRVQPSYLICVMRSRVVCNGA